MANEEHATPTTDSLGQDMNLVVGVAATAGQETVTARKAGGLIDMKLPVAIGQAPLKQCLENLAKAINIALEQNFLETELESVYKAAKVKKGAVYILHEDYIGLGDGLFAKVGRGIRSMQLSLRGPDPASPEGEAYFRDQPKLRPIRGFFNLIGRKLDLLQEFEDKVPAYVEQMLDRLEAAKMITGWTRSDWEITTTLIGLDVIIRPVKKKNSKNAEPTAA